MTKERIKHLTETELENILIKHLWEHCDFPSGIRFDCEIYETDGRYSSANVKGANLMVGQWKGVFGSLVKKEYLEFFEYINEDIKMPVYMFTEKGKKIVENFSTRRFDGDQEIQEAK